MRKIVAWDLDGTIVDTYDLMKNTYIEILGSEFKSDLSLSPWVNFKNAGLNPTANIRRYWNYYRKNVPNQAKVYPEIINCHNDLRKNGVSQVIISSLPDEIVNTLLLITNIQDIFDIVIGGSNLEYRKPNPKSIEYCIKQLNGNKKKCVIIGDGYRDQRLSFNANVHFIAAKWNHRCKLQCQYECKSPKNILSILNNILD
jgi:HAD superfamily hydrolase (TIGR01509 family)